jgi:excisionase family DNA binding protein
MRENRACAHDVLTADEVAKRFQVNVRTIYKLATSGQLPCTRIGKQFRFATRALDAMLDGGRKQ